MSIWSKETQNWVERQEQLREAVRDIWLSPAHPWRDISLPAALRNGEVKPLIIERTGQPFRFGSGTDATEEVVRAMHEAELAARDWTHD